jgi:hypothetical protein
MGATIIENSGFDRSMTPSNRDFALTRALHGSSVHRLQRQGYACGYTEVK